MRVPGLCRNLLAVIAIAAELCLGSLWMSAQSQSSHGAYTKGQACPNDDSGLTLPAGFCATIFADRIGHARH